MLGLSSHQHSAKLTAHHHTSYGGLLLLLALAGMLILLLTLGAVLPTKADSGSIGVTSVVPSTPPTTAPVITAPVNGATVTSRQITVSGACSGSYTIVLTDGAVVRGSTFCNHDGTFGLVISLDPGTNALAAHYVDALNQSGPPSATVVVTYRPIPPGTPLAALTGAQVTPVPIRGPSMGANLLTVTAPYRFEAIQPGDSFTLTGTITGGTMPYALEIDWGDGIQTLLSRPNAGSFSMAHTYNKPGRYLIKLNVSDITSATAFFQTTITVNGPAAAAPALPAVPPVVVPPYLLMIAWPVFLITCLVAISFWLGERYDRRHWCLPPPAA